MVVGHRDPARGGDLRDHALRRTAVATLPTATHPRVVHQHLCTTRGQPQGVAAAETATGSGHDGHPSVHT
ncbi:hypothetical protein GCM10017691_39460 [Pseudonocardia petroleophila]